MYTPPAVRHLTENLPGTGGLLKATPEDFVVEEVPAYPPTGEGDHLFLTVEKVGLTTREMVQRVAAALAIDADDIGVAGQKDKQALTRQVISVPARGLDVLRAANLKLEGLHVLAAARHPHKLRTGHLRGNRFTITVRGVGAGAEAKARAILDELCGSWLPNRFGPQRFGMRGDNAALGRRVLLGELHEPDRFRRRFLVSAYQSLLFNQYLDARMAEGALHRIMVGDVLMRTDSGGIFLSESRDLAYNQARLEMRHLVPTGPVFGAKMFPPGAGTVAAAREQSLLDAEGLTGARLLSLGKLAPGTRRALLVRVEGTLARQHDDTLVLGFSLPAGAYATVLLDEVMKPGSPVRHPGDS